jgi:hypothetical protein
MVGERKFLDSEGPITVEKRTNGGPGQVPIVVVKKRSVADPLMDCLDRTSQEGEGRPRGIQIPKPAAEGGRSRHTIGIFYRRGRRFPGTALDKVAPQRRTAGDQAVVAIGEGEGRQEGNGLAARSADAAPNLNPVMVFVMSLFAAATMTNDRILQANRAAAKNYFCGSIRPSSFQIAMHRGK